MSQDKNKYEVVKGDDSNLDKITDVHDSLLLEKPEDSNLRSKYGEVIIPSNQISDDKKTNAKK